MPGVEELFDLAWRDQSGYVSLSVRDPDRGKDEQGYWVDKMFAWPGDRDKILTYVDKAKTTDKDIYWAPAVFAAESRSSKSVTTIHTLWADLDEVPPESIPKQFAPTAIWESSPGRYQAMWRLRSPLNVSEQQQLNQRLTYALGADKGGWDITQVLRIPGTRNHKYDPAPKVKLLHLNGHRIDAERAINDLPEISTHDVGRDELPEARVVLAQRRDSFNTRIKQLLRAKHAPVGERSDRLWELECLLAERGLSSFEIASVAQATVWNKFRGRHDEVRRLLVEAEKAVGHAGPETEDDVLEPLEEEQVQPIAWGQFDRTHEPISWLVADVWGASEVGFISGIPKSYKSWVALDLAVSVATGTRFLGSFQSKKNDVILVQEEDPRPVLQDRLVKIAAAKGLVDVRKVGREIEIYYDLPDNLHVISNQGFTLTEEWLEQLERWIIERDAKLVVLDPLMMIAGEGFDEFKAFDFMQKVLKPLKKLRAHTKAAIVLVHHHLKASTQGGARDMYGSVALWAWEESALHLQLPAPGRITAERFSKHSLLKPLTIEVGDVSEMWSPIVSVGANATGLLDLLGTMEGGATVEELMEIMGSGRDAITRQLKQAEQQGVVNQEGNRPGQGKGRRATVWNTS